MAENSQKSSNQPLTNILLNGANYLSWARAVTVALGGRSKEGHITGTSKPDATDEKKGRMACQRFVSYVMDL